MCFDCVRVEMTRDEALSRWIQYYKGLRSAEGYEPPKEAYSVNEAVKEIRFDVVPCCWRRLAE